MPASTDSELSAYYQREGGARLGGQETDRSWVAMTMVCPATPDDRAAMAGSRNGHEMRTHCLPQPCVAGSIYLLSTFLSFSRAMRLRARVAQHPMHRAGRHGEGGSN